MSIKEIITPVTITRDDRDQPNNELVTHTPFKGCDVTISGVVMMMVTGGVVTNKKTNAKTERKPDMNTTPNTTQTKGTATPASARRWAGMERTLYLLMALCWVALLSLALLIVADVVGCERVHTQAEGATHTPHGAPQGMGMPSGTLTERLLQRNDIDYGLTLDTKKRKP